MADGFGVAVDALQGHAKSLADKKAIATEIGDLVKQSDVGNESWGVVGIFVKQDYTSMLADLNDLLGDMAEGLQHASDKFTGAAEHYQRFEEDVTKLLQDLLKKLDDPYSGTGAPSGGAPANPES
ncbi:hypothetical protein [Amycolatopsis anabasis]|uniref:hypothetical protein n=1 Tax=Amycolatopsis anabasis TaxID=1840409 RepID=UPI001FE54DDF|nr:hypothetical protein [Amycolatopsis anabasis]